MKNERQDVVIGARVSKSLKKRIGKEQERLTKLTGLKPSLNEVVRLLIEKGLQAKR